MGAIGGGEGASPRPDVSMEEVVGTRCGDVLLRNTILKSDHFPGAALALLATAAAVVCGVHAVGCGGLDGVWREVCWILHCC